jgi:preprotein translocase subunit SecA
LTLHLPLQDWVRSEEELDEEGLRARVAQATHEHYERKMQAVDREALHQFERAVMLQTLDGHWREHLGALDHLRQGIHLRGYAQKNPKQEYKREAFELFSMMLDTVRNEVTRILMTVQIRHQEEGGAAAVAAAEQVPPPGGPGRDTGGLDKLEKPVEVVNVRYQHADYDEALAGADQDPASGPAAAKAAPFVRAGQKVGRNDPCPCGSGKKYKQCHGKLG